MLKSGSPLVSPRVDDPRSGAQGDFLNGWTAGHNTRMRSLFTHELDEVWKQLLPLFRWQCGQRHRRVGLGTVQWYYYRSFLEKYHETHWHEEPLESPSSNNTAPNRLADQKYSVSCTQVQRVLSCCVGSLHLKFTNKPSVLEDGSWVEKAQWLWSATVRERTL